METKPYTPIMCHVLKEGEIPPFKLKRKTVLAGTILKHYDPVMGKMFRAKFIHDFPIVVLEEDSRVWMSDTPLEYEGIMEHLPYCHGRVLVGGLGLGMFPHLASKRKGVRKIDVIEKEQKVIDLVFHQIWTPKMRIICDDIFHYLKTTLIKYDFIYLDIWADYIGSIEDADRAASLAQRCLRERGQVRVWLQALIDRVKSQLPKEAQYPTGQPTMEPCLICGKAPRNDYAGVCMDCADALRISELYMGRR